jgi:hypothetical protein
VVRVELGETTVAFSVHQESEVIQNFRRLRVSIGGGRILPSNAQKRRTADAHRATWHLDAQKETSED